MDKLAFLAQLRKGLSGLPQEEVDERLAFYAEMIDDRMEEGLSEEEAVSGVGSVEEIAAQIVAETSLAKIAMESIRSKRRLKAWEIVLLSLGSPIWFSLLVAAFAVILSLYVSLWAVIVSLWASVAAVAACAFAGILAGAIFAFLAQGAIGMALIGAGIVCAGLGIFFWLGCKAITQGAVTMTKKMVIGMKNRRIKKEEGK